MLMRKLESAVEENCPGWIDIMLTIHPFLKEGYRNRKTRESTNNPSYYLRRTYNTPFPSHLLLSKGLTQGT